MPNDCPEASVSLGPVPGDGNEGQNDSDRLAANVRGPLVTAPTGYVHHCQPPADVFASGSEWYGEHWDSGFAQDGDPYGIQREYVTQSASPNALYNPNLPTQEQADAVARQGEEERESRRIEGA
jgi:hypothetical protein